MNDRYLEFNAVYSALTDQVGEGLGRGAKVEFVEIDDPGALHGAALIAANHMIFDARRETAAALAAGDDNPEVLYRVPGMPEWCAVRKTALALHPLYSANRAATMGAGITFEDLRRPFEWGRTPIEELTAIIGPERASAVAARYQALLQTPHTGDLLKWHQANLDACAIRTRAAAASQLVGEIADRWSEKPIRVASLACGAAGPIASLLKGLQKDGLHVRGLTLLDRDPMALGVGRAVAEAEAPSVPLELVLGDLIDIRAMRATDLYGPLRGQTQTIIEMLGLFEYLPDVFAVDLIRRCAEMVQPGGVIVFANMLSPRPEQDVFADVVRWPALVQRTVGQVLNLVEQAGFSAHQTRVVIPEGELVYQIALIDTAR